MRAISFILLCCFAPWAHAAGMMDTLVNQVQAASGGWMVFGGTSVAAPLVAGIVNNSNHFYASSTVENTKIYAAKAAIASNFRIPRTGDCGNHHAYVVSTGWNPCTGVGSPINRNNQ